jgi:pyruvate dehydrogenase E2 component (dihydrolipoyllysine-residue acetyltransferase)
MPMNPLIEVSTDRGRNMRETCARVLAAALMTGAIATVVGMAALVGTPTEARRPVAAPPSSLQRSVRLTAQPAPRHRRTAARLATAHTIHVQSRPEAVARRLVVVRSHRAGRPVQHHRELAAAKPQPAPAVAPPAPAVAPAPAPAPAEPAPPATGENADNGDESHSGHGHGHEHGHSRNDQDE